jgi:hypothetical protein
MSLNTQRRPLADTSKAATLKGKSKVVEERSTSDKWVARSGVRDRSVVG